MCRYYIKHEAQTEPLLPDSMLDYIVRESQLHFLQLNCVEVATQLTLRDLQCFRDIQQSEYIIDLFKLHSDNKPHETTHLDAFTEASLSHISTVRSFDTFCEVLMYFLLQNLSR